MDNKQKLDFVLKMTKHALEHVQHFDSGGTVLNGDIAAGTGSAANPNLQGNGVSTPDITVGGGVFGGGTKVGVPTAQGAPITPGTNLGQLNSAYTGVQGALGNANTLAGTLQGGVNQGVSTQGNLTNQLEGIANGTGYNPAQASLNQNTGRNIAAQAALAAGVRGAGTNAGLIASQNAAQGANTEQEAVGQGASLQAQQSLAAQNELAGIAAQQVGQGTNAVQVQNQAQQGEQNILQGANTAANQAQVAQRANINSTNAGIFNTEATLGQQNSQANNAGVGQALSSVASVIPFLFAKGGKVPKHIETMARIYHPHLFKGGSFVSGGVVPGKPKVNHDAYKNDAVSAKLTPGEVVIDLDTLHRKDKVGKMARFVAQNIERKKSGRALR